MSTGLTVTVGGDTVNQEIGKLTIRNRINERSDCSLSLFLPEGSKHVKKNEIIEVTDKDGNTLFKGFADQPTEEKLTNDQRDLRVDIKGKDMHYLADKRVVADSFTDTLSGEIVKSLVDNILTEEGVTKGTIEDGVNMKLVQFNYIPVADAIDQLADANGYWWEVDFDKKLHFRDRGSKTVSFSLDATNQQHTTASVNRKNPKYRNQQWVLDSTAKTDSITDTLETNGTKETWTLRFPLAEEPTIEENGTTLDSSEVTVKGNDSGKYHYKIGDSVISQDVDETTLAGGDTLSITYKGQQVINTRSKSEFEINEQSKLTGGSGIVEDVESRPELDTLEASSDVAKDLIQKFGTLGRTLEMETRETRLEPGQIVEVTDSKYGLNKACMLVEQVELDDRLVQGDAGYLRVKLIEGPINKSWTQTFYEMGKRSNKDTIRANISKEDLLIIRQDDNHIWSKDNRPDIFELIRPNDKLKPGFTPSFRRDERVEYVAVGDGDTPGDNQLDNERARAQVTITENEETDLIRTIATFAEDQANFTWTEIGWFGGGSASAQKDSGTMIKWEAVNVNKSNAEAQQVESKDQQVTPTIDFEDDTIQDFNDNSGNFTTSKTPEPILYLTQDNQTICAGEEINNEQKVIATAQPDILANGQQPDAIEWYMIELPANKGAGVQLLNSNGNIECGFALANPEWYLDSEDGIVEEYSGDGTDRWVYVRFDFYEWDSSTPMLDIQVNDLFWGNVFNPVEGGYLALGAGAGQGGFGTGGMGPGYDALKQGVDIETLQVTNFESGSWTGNSDFHAYFDRFSVVLDRIQDIAVDVCA